MIRYKVVKRGCKSKCLLLKWFMERQKSGGAVKRGVPLYTDERR